MEALAVVRALEAPGVETRLTLLARSGAPLRRVLAALADHRLSQGEKERIRKAQERADTL